MRESEQGRQDVDAAIVARLPDGCTLCRGDEGTRYDWQGPIQPVNATVSPSISAGVR